MLTEEQFRDKVYACWMGKNIGGTLGGPLEGIMELLDIKGYTQEFVTAVENDDLDLQLVNLHCLEQYAGQVTSANLAKEWLSHVHFQFDEYGHALTNMRKGLRPSLSGCYNNFFTDCMGSPIRSELWGIVCAGKPELAAYYACQDACVDHAGGEGVWGEVFFAVLECLAFEETDVEKLIAAALSYLPEDSRTAGAVRLLLHSWREKKSWKENRELLIKEFGGENFTDAPLNIAFTLMGLLYGEGFTERLLITTDCGYDTDCTCATIASIMGILYGTSYLDEQWVKPLGEKILVSSPIYGFDAPKTIGELTERSIRAAKLAAAVYEAAPDKEIFSVNRETDREITLLPEGSFACCELICETQYEDKNPSIAPGETKTVYLTVQNKSLVPYTLDITAQTPSGLEVMSAGGKAPAAEGCGRRVSIAPGGRQTVDFKVKAEKSVPRRAYYSCRFLLKQEIEGNWTQMEVPFTLMATNDWKLEADGISLGIFHGTDSAVRLKQAGLPEGKARTLTASSRLWLPEEKEVRLLVVCRKPAALLVDGRTVVKSDLDTPLIPAYHRAPSEKCATLRLAAGAHDIEIRLKDVEESDLFYFYVVNPANHFAAEIDCVLTADGNGFWQKNENERPLDRLVEDGGFCGIFRTIGCVGDSLSSGEYEIVKEDGTREYIDLYEYSWGQFISYTTGSKVYNFSRGGMTAKEYMESFAEANDFWNPRKACQAYIIALGVNDLYGQMQEVGTIEDICREDWKKNRPTFAGYFAQVVQRLKEIQKDAKFFFVTMPQETDRQPEAADRHAALMYDMADFFSNSYVIDLRKYGPVYDRDFKELFYYNGHMHPCGYQLTAKMIMSYMDHIIRHHMKDFKLAGMIGHQGENPKEG